MNMESSTDYKSSFTRLISGRKSKHWTKISATHIKEMCIIHNMHNSCEVAQKLSSQKLKKKSSEKLYAAWNINNKTLHEDSFV